MDLFLANEDIHEAFRVIAQQAQLNIFLDPDIEGRVTLAGHSISWSEALSAIARNHQLRVQRLTVHGVEAPCLWVSRLSSPPAPQTEFGGERVVLRFEDPPIREAVKQFAGATKAKIEVEDGLDLPVTLNLRVPWDLGLAHLAQKYSLHLVLSTGTIRVTR